MMQQTTRMRGEDAKEEEGRNRRLWDNGTVGLTVMMVTAIVAQLSCIVRVCVAICPEPSCIVCRATESLFQPSLAIGGEEEIRLQSLCSNLEIG